MQKRFNVCSVDCSTQLDCFEDFYFCICQLCFMATIKVRNMEGTQQWILLMIAKLGEGSSIWYMKGFAKWFNMVNGGGENRLEDATCWLINHCDKCTFAITTNTHQQDRINTHYQIQDQHKICFQGCNMVIGGGEEKIGGGNLLQENPFQEQQVDTEPFGAFSKVAIKHDGEG